MKVEPMESGHWSGTPEHQSREVRRNLLEGLEVGDPRVISALSALHDIGMLSPEFHSAAPRVMATRSREDREYSSGDGGRARKVSVSMPEELSAAVQERVGRGEFSRYVSDAVARQLEADLLAELVALLEAAHGPVSEEMLAEAEAAWPDAE